MKSKVFYAETDWKEDERDIFENYIEDEEERLQNYFVVFCEVEPQLNDIIMIGDSINQIYMVKEITTIDELADLVRQKREEYHTCEVWRANIKRMEGKEMNEIGSADIMEFKDPYSEMGTNAPTIDVAEIVKAFMLGPGILT